MAGVTTYSCTRCRPIDTEIIEAYQILTNTSKAVSQQEAGRVAAENARVLAEQGRTQQFAEDHSVAQEDHRIASGDHTLAVADHGTASDDHVLAVADHGTASDDHTASTSATTRANNAAAEAEHMVDIHQGPPGPAGKAPVVGANGNWWTWDDETEAYVDSGEQAQGPVGATPDISIGTVTTGEPGDPAAASMGGTAAAPILNLTIPKGQKGDQGNTGSSVAYPFELVNNETTDDATKAHSAAGAKRLKDEETKLKDTVNGSYLAENFTKEVVNFATAPLRNYNIFGDTGKYGTSSSTKHAIFPAEKGTVVDVTANSTYGTKVAFVSTLDLPSSGGDVPVVAGTSVIELDVNESIRLIAPSGTVAVLAFVGSGASAPSYMAIYRPTIDYESGNKVMQMVSANGYRVEATDVSSQSTYYGWACQVKKGKQYLVEILSAGTGTKYYGMLSGIVASGVAVNVRDTESVADVHFVISATEDGYFLVTKSNSTMSVSVTEIGIPELYGNDKDVAMVMGYKTIYPLSYTLRNYSLNLSTGLYTTSASYKHILVPVTPNGYVKVVGNSINGGMFAFVKTDAASVSGAMPDYAEGTGILGVHTNETKVLKVPSDAHYFLVYLGTEPFDRYPTYIGVSSDTLGEQDWNDTTIKSFLCMKGSLSAITGLYPTSITYASGRSHTPRFIRNRGKFRVLYVGQLSVLYYDKNQNFLDATGLITGPVTLANPNAAFYRVAISDKEAASVEIQSYWQGDDEVFQKLPVDEGYQQMSFGVTLNKGVAPNDTGDSTITTGFVKTLNFGVIHLPASYKESGNPTPLIIYLHGASDRYGITSDRFAENVRYSPEWDSMGFAQMDVDMLPEYYNTGTSNKVNSGTGDDAVCVEAAYNWAIEHFNIRRDGVYLFGRSRGGAAVLSILARLNKTKLPVICALSNAGANSLLLTDIFRPSNNVYWGIFCDSMGLSGLEPPAYSSGSLISNQAIRDFLRENIEIWWDRALVAFPMCIENPTEYQTPTQIFDLLVSSYTSAEPGKTFIEDFIEKCKFRSPVPLRFDWCAGDTVQPWESTSYGTYSSAGKDGFVDNKISGNAIYRRWPSCPEGENPHYHEMFNLEDYTLPNGVEIQDASMAMTEWLLWAMGQDERFTI